jgi:hypothetical protein
VILAYPGEVTLGKPQALAGEQPPPHDATAEQTSVHLGHLPSGIRHRPGIAAPPRSPEAALVASVLRQTVMLPEAAAPSGRTFDPIWRPAAGDWRTLHRCMEPAEVAALVLDPAGTIGLRHRHQTRLLVLDIDRHGSAVSPYWDPHGPTASPALQRLEAEAVRVGASIVVYRTPRGGWHVWIVLPVAVHHQKAAAIGAALLARADLEPAPGRLELFPSRTAWSPSPDPRARPRSNGFRLPGQAGGAVWVGGALGWSDDPVTAWQEAAAAVELTDGAATPEWDALLQEAAALRRRHRPPLGSAAAGHHRKARRPCVRWTGPAQSNGNLGDLANLLYQPGLSPEQLGERVAAAARSAPGFAEHASEDTKHRLNRWAVDWAQHCIANPPRRQKSTDPGYNQRQERLARSKMITAAYLAVKKCGPEAMNWSLRQIATVAGVHRQTAKKHLQLWKARAYAAVLSGRGRRLFGKGGTHPLPRGGHLAPQATGGSLPAVPCVENRPLHPVPIGPPAQDRPSPLEPLPPSTAHDLLSAKRARERAELEAWLAVT